MGCRMSIVFLKIAWCAFVLHTLVSPFAGTLTRLCGYVMIIGMVLYSVLGIDFRQANRKIILIFSLFTYGFIMGIAGNVADVSTYYQGLILFTSMLLCIIKRPQQYNVNEKDFFFFLNFCQSIVFCAFTYLPFPYKYTVVNEYGFKGFTMGLGNTNATSMMLLITMMLLVIEIYFTEKKSIRWRNVVVCVLLFRTLWLLSSRTSVLCFIIYVVLLFFLRKGKQFGIKWFWGAVVVSALNIVVQLSLAQMKSIVILGKPLASGRDRMYEDVIARILEYPLDYILGRIDLYGLGNYHNGPLSLVCAFGLIGLIIYYSIWRFAIKEILDRKEVFAQYTYLALVMVLVSTASEASLLLGGVPFSLQTILLVRLGVDSFTPQRSVLGTIDDGRI